ncbi:AraC-like ligand-binding domain-containing protein [Chachezhania sediminis]|uniref:AraC-like ligand-binding domain-containing protein n=1 Tax=Chachezhania sediminis TaxID=2599291 RepID=UPI00131DF50F|nr:helix-turn-helix domain-containing protein [Chachezhania sediminis]
MSRTGINGAKDGKATIQRSVLELPAGARPEERFQSWQSQIAPFFDVGSGDRIDLAAFDARFDLSLIGDMIFGSCQTVAQRFQRSALKVAHEPHDMFMLQMFRTGETRAQIGAREVIARPGDIWVIDLAEPIDAVNSDFHNLSIIVPRSLIEGNLRSPDAHHLRRIPADTPMARIFGNFLAGLMGSVGSMTLADAAELAPATARLSEALLNVGTGHSRPEMDASAADQVLCLAARRLIESHLTDPDMDPDKVASMLGVSRSKLYRVFAPMGGIAAHIRNRRLKRSSADLLDRNRADRPIYEIAFKWAFTSESDYSRAFRRQFGLSPREARGAYHAGLAAPGIDSPDHADWLRHIGA